MADLYHTTQALRQMVLSTVFSAQEKTEATAWAATVLFAYTPFQWYVA